MQIFSPVCDSRGFFVVVRLQETELVQMSVMVLHGDFFFLFFFFNQLEVF